MSVKRADDLSAVKELQFDEVLDLMNVSSPIGLFMAALDRMMEHSGGTIDLCSIINAKSGACPEDCSYCAQSSRSRSDVEVYPLVEDDVILSNAEEAHKNKVKRFCIVTSGRSTSGDELKRIAYVITKLRDIGLLPCATLGLLGEDELKILKDAGLERYHHNLETSERFFPEICSTHSYTDKLRTIEAAKKVGLSVCSGGIFGMGESWRDRLDMAYALRDIGVDSIPVNYLMPIEGTPLSGMTIIEPIEALAVISIFRLIMPQRQIRVCGGRIQALGELHPLIFTAGADGLLTGNYLTTTGREYRDDLRVIEQMGFNCA
ncbi:MAG: biotin synthase BioB [Nitrospirota bacterium]|nr:MAG: biotin synthase BioB [Nitrospirota bacterium]